MTRTARDSALMLSVMAQPDTRDGYSGNPRAPDWLTPPPANLKGWRIAFSADLGYVDVAPDIAQRVEEAITYLEALGATVERIDPGFSDPLKTFNTLWFAGATQALENSMNSSRQRSTLAFWRLHDAGKTYRFPPTSLPGVSAAN